MRIAYGDPADRSFPLDTRDGSDGLSIRHNLLAALKLVPCSIGSGISDGL